MYASKEGESDDLIIQNLISENSIKSEEEPKGLRRIPSNKLLTKNIQTTAEKVRFKKKFDELQDNLIENMSCYDQNLKLKLQMNLDLVNRDQQIWKDIPIKTDMYGQSYKTFSDPDLSQIVERMQRILIRLQIEPYHHAQKAI